MNALTKDLVFDSKYNNKDGSVNTQSSVILTSDEFNQKIKEYSDIFKLLESDVTPDNQVAPELVDCLNSVKTKFSIEQNGNTNSYQLSFGAILSIMETFDKTLRSVIGVFKQNAINEKNVVAGVTGESAPITPEVVSDGQE